MHLVESYALNTGLKIGKPYLYDKFFPIPFEEDYLTFQPFSKGKAKNYKYWQDVIDILFPILRQNKMRIVQLGLPNDPKINGCEDLRGKTAFGHVGYLIKNGRLHFGADSCGIHFASGMNKKMVGLYSIMSPKNCGPYWSKKDDVKCIEIRKKPKEKYHYHYEANAEAIDEIKPERIAAEIFEKLDIHNPYPFKTLYTGDQYQDKKIQLVPYNYVKNIGDMGLDSIIVRMDLKFNQSVLVSQLQISPCSIMTDKEIDIDLLVGFKDKIRELAFLISEDTDPNYFKKLLDKGCKFHLLTKLNDEELNKIKLDYLDFGTIQKFPSPKKSDFQKLIGNKDLDKLFFKTSTLYVLDGHLYGFPLHSAENQELPNIDSNTPRHIIDHPLFWESLPHMTLLEKS
jgi:hypothetical protein